MILTIKQKIKRLKNKSNNKKLILLKIILKY